MAVSHLGYDKATTYGSQLNSVIQHGETWLDSMADQIATMTLMIDGDGSSATHFTYMTAKYGFTDNATAKAAFEEMNAAYAKVSGNASVSGTNAALLQLIAKLR